MFSNGHHRGVAIIEVKFHQSKRLVCGGSCCCCRCRCCCCCRCRCVCRFTHLHLSLLFFSSSLLLLLPVEVIVSSFSQYSPSFFRFLLSLSHWCLNLIISNSVFVLSFFFFSFSFSFSFFPFLSLRAIGRTIERRRSRKQARRQTCNQLFCIFQLY